MESSLEEQHKTMATSDSAVINECIDSPPEEYSDCIGDLQPKEAAHFIAILKRKALGAVGFLFYWKSINAGESEQIAQVRAEIARDKLSRMIAT